MILLFIGSLFYLPKIYGQTKTTSVGITLIEYSEGFQPRAYLCPAHVWTIFYGHTGYDVHPGMTGTRQQGELVLKNDLLRFDNYIKRTVDRNMKWHEYDALSSFVFNVGYKINSELKEALDTGNTRMVITILMKYTKAKVNGRLIILPGLLQRRKAESALYQDNLSSALFKGLL
jgi:lysozyme